MPEFHAIYLDLIECQMSFLQGMEPMGDAGFFKLMGPTWQMIDVSSHATTKDWQLFDTYHSFLQKQEKQTLLCFISGEKQTERKMNLIRVIQ